MMSYHICLDQRRLGEALPLLIPRLGSVDELGDGRLFMGIQDGAGKILAGAALHRITGFDAMICLGSDCKAWGYCLRRLGRFIGLVAFGVLGLKRLSAKCAEDNDNARRLLEASGFTLEGYMPLAWDGERAAMIYGCEQGSWNWRSRKDGV